MIWHAIKNQSIYIQIISNEFLYMLFYLILS